MKLHHKILGAGPPLVILHGLFGMLDNWQTVGRKLEAKFKTVLVDLRNHGKSPHSAAMNYKVMAEDVHELITDLQLGPCFVLGHSLGGKVAMQLAVLYPDDVSKLIVVDIAPGAYPRHHESVLEAIGSIDPSKLEGRGDAEKNFRLFLGQDDETILFLMKNLHRLPEGGFEWKANMPVLISEYDEITKGIEMDHSFEKPVLFIRGGKSNSLQDSDWPGIQKLFPQAHLITLPGAGHWVHTDQPLPLIETVTSFLES